jgi:hypothetical protein
VNQLETWPPPDWTEVVILWSTMLANSDYTPNAITEWCYNYPGHGRWHLHGYKQTEGFAFRFEDARDATAFGLRWT